MADGKTVEYWVDNGVAVIELNRPPVNSYTHELLRELDDALLQARFDDNVHVLVITSKVDKFFSAGADINMLSSKPLSYKNNFALHGHEVDAERVRRVLVPHLEAVDLADGHALHVALARHVDAHARIGPLERAIALGWSESHGPFTREGYI